MRMIYSIVGCLVVAAGWAQPQYEVVNLTKMFGEDFTARDINNNGVIAGSMFIDFATTQACFVQNGKLTMLPMYQGKHDWYPRAINDNGEVLGTGELNGTFHSFLYRNGKVIDIGVAGDESFPPGRALSNNGQVVVVLRSVCIARFLWRTVLRRCF